MHQEEDWAHQVYQIRKTQHDNKNKNKEETHSHNKKMIPSITAASFIAPVFVCFRPMYHQYLTNNRVAILRLFSQHKLFNAMPGQHDNDEAPYHSTGTTTPTRTIQPRAHRSSFCTSFLHRFISFPHSLHTTCRSNVLVLQPLFSTSLNNRLQRTSIRTGSMFPHHHHNFNHKTVTLITCFTLFVLVALFHERD